MKYIVKIPVIVSDRHGLQDDMVIELEVDSYDHYSAKDIVEKALMKVINEAS